MPPCFFLRQILKVLCFLI